jgi:hypothetical protein
MRPKLPILVAILLLAVSTLAPAAPSRLAGYRLAGVLAAGDTYIAFLELPEGSQVLVRRGSRVRDGEVVQIGPHSLRIRFPTGSVELALEGSGKPQAVAEQRVVVSGDEQGHVIRREVDVQALRRELDAAGGPSHESPTNASGPGPAPDEQRTVTQHFAPLLDLPPDARVVAVNETKVISASAAISTVEETLAKGMPARLTLQTPKGMKRVYLMPMGNGSQAKKQN